MRLVAVAVAAVMAAACGKDTPSPPVQPTPTPAAVVRVDIDGPANRDIGAVGDTLQLRAVALFDDATRTDVTNEASWSVLNGSVLSVTARGLVTAVGNGGTFVTATYRERSGTTNLTVRPQAGARFPLTGVVLDAETRQPIGGAHVSANPGTADREALTDTNGFFDLGTAIRPVIVTASLFGYGDVSLIVSEPGGTAHATIALPPNGPFIERTVNLEGTYFDGLAMATHRVVTRPGGVFDAVATTRGCDNGSDVAIYAESGGMSFVGTSLRCAARVRFVVPASEVRLMVRSYRSTDMRLTYREPR
jgi:hypothetical protein